MSLAANRRKGAKAESVARDWLNHRYPQWSVERVALSGVLDRGDLTGVPNLAIEVKASDLVNPPWRSWVKQATVEAKNAGQPAWCVLYRPPRTPAPAGWLVIAPLATIGTLRRPLPAAFDIGPWHRRHQAQTELAQHLGHIGPVLIVDPATELGCVGAPIFFDYWNNNNKEDNNQ